MSPELKAHTLKTLQRCLDFRRQYDSKRAGFYRQYVGQRDAQKYPDNVTNRSNTFVPYPLANVETIVSRVLDAFFSFDPWFETDGSTEYDDSASDSMQQVLYKKLKQARAVEHVETLVRNIGIYGFGALKIDWNWDYKTVVKPVQQPVVDPHTQQPVINPATGQQMLGNPIPQKFKVPLNCPRITAVDIYDILVDPDGGIVAHLTERTIVEMLRENENYTAKTNTPLYDPTVLSQIVQHLQESQKDGWESVIIRFAEVWNAFENTVTVMCFGDDKDAMAWKDLRAGFRASNLSAYKRKIYEGNDVLWHGPNPFDHARIPIVFTSYIKLPNELYGMGAIEIIEDMNESLNKMVNMVTDNWNLGINRRFAYDVNADIDHDALNLSNVPGGKVPVNGEPDKVLFPLPLFTPNAGDYQIMEVYKQMLQTASGVSDFYSGGVGGPSGNHTATGISGVINEANYRFKMFIRNVELDILQPMLNMCAALVQQFLTDPEEVLITKNPAGPQIPKWVSIDPSSIIGNFEFNLVAANYATSKEVRQRNLMAFMNIAQQTPAWNAAAGIREFGKVMEIRNIDELLYTDAQVQAMQQAQQQQAQQQMLMQEIVRVEADKEIAKTHAEYAVAGRPSGEGGSANPKAPSPTPGPNPSLKRREGRPAKAQFEGKIPGANGPTNIVKQTAQAHGANAVGLEGLSQ